MNLLQIWLSLFLLIWIICVSFHALIIWSYIVNNPVIKFLKEMSYLDGFDWINLAQH